MSSDATELLFHISIYLKITFHKLKNINGGRGAVETEGQEERKSNCLSIASIVLHCRHFPRNTCYYQYHYHHPFCPHYFPQFLKLAADQHHHTLPIPNFPQCWIGFHCSPPK
ncbi:hypothetical protein T02_2303 [Trichinella nativa]|uniref:Uncharacterized protein n=1 Tax=Trichinella nativa TaxID=6335 RepID=A0A0V1KX06_9BILA|nr:hypothetical protein T02_2303 [Trichinella nativa]